MAFVWQREDGARFPKTWYKFQAKDLDSDELVNYRVQDLPEERFDDAIAFLKTNFLVDENLNSAMDIANDELSTKELVSFWCIVLTQKLTLCCFKEGSEEIIGLNLLSIISDHEPLQDLTSQFETHNLHLLVNMKRYIQSKISIHKFHNVEYYLGAFGLSVSSKYRCRGIGSAILSARIPLAKHFNITLTSTLFTSVAAQSLAGKLGYETIFSVSMDDLEKAGIKFPEPKTKVLKQMSLTIKCDE